MGLLGFLWLLPSAARADYISSQLGQAGNIAVFGTSTASLVSVGSGVTVDGNVGMADSSGSVDMAFSATIEGNVLLESGATFTGSGFVSGSVLSNQNSFLDPASASAVNASTTFAGLTPTQSAGSTFSGTETINLTSGLNIIDVTGFDVASGTTLILNGPPGSQLVINDSGDFNVLDSTIQLSGGLTNNDVVYNVTGGPAEIQTSTVSGIVLDQSSDISVNLASTLFGNTIGGENISIDSSTIMGVTTNTVPEPSTLLLVSAGLIGVVGVKLRRHLV